VAVALAVDTDAAERIPGDVTALLSSDGLIGNLIVVLRDGTPSAPSLEHGQSVPSTSAVSMEHLMVQLDKTNTQLQEVAAHVEVITGRLAAGKGSLGKMLVDDVLYDRVLSSVDNLEGTLRNADVVARNSAAFTAKLNTEGSLFHQLATDRTTHGRLTTSLESLQAATADAAAMAASLKASTNDPTTAVGVLLQDREAGADLGSTLENLDVSAELLAQDLEALQHNFLLRGYFKKKEREERRAERRSR
jgi:phospholipid/cholesterol/gamma-HCH transport system substrate-binding protein